MDFPLENAGLNEGDLNKVFRYAPRKTTIVRCLTTDPSPLLWFLDFPEDYQTWLQRGVPSIQRDSGLVLVLARRAGENASLFEQLAAGAASFGQAEADSDFKSSLNEKDRSYSWPEGKAISAPPGKKRERHEKGNLPGGGREVRQVPFEKDVFREICQAFFVHPSISRAISRADVPLFSRAEIRINQKSSKWADHHAIVYNCRSANTWKNDLALTVTYFPRSKLMFGILFGCTAAIEKEVLNRLASAKEHAFHPLLLPGIFAELERERMVEVVESTIDEMEGAIFELDTGSGAKNTHRETSESSHLGGARYARRTVWLNTTFLRNRLQIWKTQLLKMIQHVDELSNYDSPFSLEAYGGDLEDRACRHAVENDHSSMHRTGCLIKDRLRAIVEEFDEMIDDCSMRVDGMTIATQWSQGDTNVDIAAAAGRDSSQMRSISLVTMIFLPGTFFARKPMKLMALQQSHVLDRGGE
ncbi:hypothetical protein DL771_002660 [Monosporascus sp. 5C6A]|nr:hypothetical protein DL771_002660 [Monosporascus sp. 5C6A]